MLIDDRKFVFQIPVPGRFPTGKVGRNDPCPCGTGKKFKKCCLNKQPQEITIVPREVVEETERRLAAHETRRQRHLATHGQIREPIHTEFQGRKVVAVGDQLFFSPTERPWRTFHDFLVAYARGRFGQGWADSEERKRADHQHPAYKMSRDLDAFIQSGRGTDQGDGIRGGPSNGAVASFLTLSYDLFVVADNVKLQKRLLKRLKRQASYQGARYELFVAATMARAGFSIEYEDDKDGSRTHPEFVATHKRTTTRVAVEAKSRHRSGVLGQPGSVSDSRRAEMRRIFLDALDKRPKLPLVVFLDINLPPVSSGPDPSGKPPWLDEWEETLASIRLEDWKNFALVICTNMPFHYGDFDQPAPAISASAHLSRLSEYSISHEVLADIGQAAKELAGEVPHEFPPKTSG